MKIVTIWHDDKKYQVTLDDKGQAIAYHVEVHPRGRRTSFRLLWSAERHGHVNGDIPQGLKDVINARGASEAIAYAMGW
jgi:hypothetical protein